MAAAGGGSSGDENGCAETIWKEGHGWSPTGLDWEVVGAWGEEEGFQSFLGDKESAALGIWGGSGAQVSVWGTGVDRGAVG